MSTFWAAKFDYHVRLARVEGKGTNRMVLVESAEDVIGQSYISGRLLKQTHQSKVFESKAEAVQWLSEQISRKREALHQEARRLDEAGKKLQVLESSE